MLRKVRVVHAFAPIADGTWPNPARTRRLRAADATPTRRPRDGDAPATRHLRSADATGTRRERDADATATRRRSPARPRSGSGCGGPFGRAGMRIGVGREGIALPAGVPGQRLGPAAIERRAREPLPQPMRARPRHARRPRRPRDAAELEQRDEEDALPGEAPLRPERRGGRLVSGRWRRWGRSGGLLVHRGSRAEDFLHWKRAADREG